MIKYTSEDGYYKAYFHKDKGLDKYIGDFVALEDGFYYWFPNTIQGCLSQSNLQEIADALDELNVQWRNQINSDLSIKVNSAVE